MPRNALGIAITASVMRMSHAGVFVTRDGSWGIKIDQPQECLCTYRVPGAGMHACVLYTRMAALNMALEACSGKITILCTQLATCALIADWREGKSTMPRWYCSHSPGSVKLAMQTVEKARETVHARSANITVFRVIPERDTMAEAAWQIAQDAVQGRLPVDERGIVDVDSINRRLDWT